MPDPALAPLSLKTGLPLLRLPNCWSPDQAYPAVSTSHQTFFKHAGSVRGYGRVIYTNYFRYNLQPVTRCQAALAPRSTCVLLHAPPSMARWRRTHPGFS